MYVTIKSFAHRLLSFTLMSTKLMVCLQIQAEYNWILWFYFRFSLLIAIILKRKAQIIPLPE